MNQIANALRRGGARPQRPQRPAGIQRPQRPAAQPTQPTGRMGYSDPRNAPVLMPGGQKQTFKGMQALQSQQQQAQENAIRQQNGQQSGSGFTLGRYNRNPSELDQRMSRMNTGGRNYWTPGQTENQMADALRRGNYGR